MHLFAMELEIDSRQNDKKRSVDTLINYCLDLPISFAIWQDQGDCVLVSSKMQSLLKFCSCVVSSLDFVKNISGIFGNFLCEAVEKLSANQFSNGKYSINYHTKYNKTYTLSLRYNIRGGIYIFTATDFCSSSVDNSSHSEIKTALNEKIEILNEILDNLPVYVWQKNKNSKLLHCNKYYADAMNLSVREVISGNKWLFKTPSVFQFGEKRLDSEIKINENSNKKFKLTEFISTVNKDYILGFANEFIDVHGIELERDVYERCLNLVIEHASDGVSLFDIDGKLLFQNSFVSKLFCLTDEEVKGKFLLEIVDSILSKEIFVNNDKEYRKSLLNAISNASSEPIIKHLQLNNGKIINVFIVTNEDKTLLFLFKDVTNSLTKERELHSTQAVYQNTLNNIDDGIIIFSNDNHIKFANTVVQNIFGNTHEGDFIKDYFEDIKNNFVENLLNVTEHRLTVSDIICYSDKTLEYMCAPLPNGLNLLKFKDVSEFKSLETSLKTASEKVTQISDLKTNLITTIADEYVTPLSTVINLAEILNNKYFGELNEKQAEYCNSIIKTAGYLKNISEAITDIARIQTDQMNFAFNETDINNFISDIVDEFKKIAPDVALKFVSTPPQLNAYIDVTSLHAAIFHIILRSIHMIEKESDIEIKVQIDTNTDRFFSIEIIDTQLSIDKSEIENYRKYLLKNNFMDDMKTIEVGYVLANCIVRKHNGAMTITSEENKGTIIKIRLPISQFFA